MKTKFALAAIFTLIFAAATCAQTDVAASSKTQTKAANYSGKWNLDVKKSKLNERQNIESMTMNVEQNEKDLKIESSVKRGESPAAADNGQRRGGLMNGGGMRGGGFGGGEDQTFTYILDGKEVVNDMTKSAAGKFTYKGAQEKDGKLKLEHTREFDSPNGPMKIKTNETWSISADGKTLTINRETVTPRGANTSEMVFTK